MFWLRQDGPHYTHIEWGDEPIPPPRLSLTFRVRWRLADGLYWAAGRLEKLAERVAPL